MKSFSALLIACVFALVCFTTTSCSVHRHNVGNVSANPTVTKSTHQWYAFWGLLAINKDEKANFTKDVNDAQIVTKTTFVDGLINGLISFSTCSRRTVEVRK